MSAKGRTMRTQGQQFVLRLLSYFEREKENGGSLIPLSCIQERVADALGIAINTVKRVKARNQNKENVSSPGKKRPRKSQKSRDLPDTSKMMIREKLYNMYKDKKHVTVKSLNIELKQHDLNISISSLNRTLHDIGFKFKKEDNRRALIEKSHIASLRLKFLKGYKENLTCLRTNSPYSREVVFLDETWIFAKGNPGKSWQNEDIRSVRKPEGYDGKRYIIVHGGSVSGFVKGASLLFTAKSTTQDYHGEMNGDVFKRWLQDSLLNNLEKPSLIIMDNAPYHSMILEKQPTSLWPKGDIIKWLINNNIPHNPTSFKAELLAIAKVHKKEVRYEVDEIIRKCGHEVLRLPPYHCEFNAIELVWARAKKYYNDNIGRDGYGDDKTISMWNEALSDCSSEFWAQCIKHTEEIINKWYEREKLLDVSVGELIINLDSESSSDESDLE